MNLFTEQMQELNTADRKKAVQWTDTDLKERMVVVIKDTTDAEIDRVSIRLGGTTPVKIVNDQNSFTIKKGSLTKLEILNKIKGVSDDELIPKLQDAHKRLMNSLHKSKLARAKRADKIKKLREQDSLLFAAQKQEETLKVAMNLNRLKREKAKANTLAG